MSTDDQEKKKKKTAHTPGYLELEDIPSALDKANELWTNVGKTDLYSTGLPILDDYLGGGFGSKKSGELILIHSTSKTYKSTFSWQMVKTALERGEKLGLIILEGRLPESLVTLKQLYAPVQKGDKVVGYERFDKLMENVVKNKQLISLSRKFLENEFEIKEITDWMMMQKLAGVSLFLIDPIGYVADYAHSNEPSYKLESKLMKQLSNFVYDTCSTVICIQHNVKDGDYLNPAHRQAAIGGSQSFSKSPTKVIELRNEGPINAEDPKGGKLISLEMYMARSVRDWRGYPVILQVISHPDGKGRFFSMIKYDEEEGNVILNGRDGKKNKDSRGLWFGQVKGDLEELVNDL